MKLNQTISIEGTLTTINDLVDRPGFVVTTAAPFRVYLYDDADTDMSGPFYRWSVSRYAAQSLAARGAAVRSEVNA